MDKRFNFIHSNAKKVWYLNGQKFESDKGTNNGKQKAIAYAREHLLDEKDIKKFDSLMEFNRYLFLEKLQEEGKIESLKDHFIFKLLPSFENTNNVMHEELLYEADFYYFDVKKQQYVVEDVKGNLEDVFRVKWKLFDWLYKSKNLSIVCVRMRSRGNPYDPESWYCFDENEKGKKNITKLREKNKSLELQLKKLESEKRKELKEKARLKELMEKLKLTTREQKRLEELRNKYEITN